MAFPTKFNNTTAKQAARKLHVLKITGVHVGKTEQFLAFLTSYNQSFTSTWNSEAVFGRIDPIATFQGNTRTLSMAWDLPAANLQEAKGNLNRFGNLAKLIYPSYVQGGPPSQIISQNALALGKPPLIRIKYANIISAQNPKGLLGFISSINWSPNIDMGVFEDGNNGVYPKVVSLSIEFQALHEDNMGWDNQNKFQSSTFPFEG